MSLMFPASPWKSQFKKKELAFKKRKVVTPLGKSFEFPLINYENYLIIFAWCLDK